MLSEPAINSGDTVDYRQMQYFVCLYEEGSVTRAAKRLNIVQPALSMQIARLEQTLERQLFVRSPRGMTPTAHGKHIYDLFMPVLAEFERARAQLRESSGELVGHATIGLPASLAQVVLADVLAEFVASYPRVTVSVTEAYTEALVQSVAAGLLDAAIVNRPRHLALAATPVLDEDLLLVTSADFAALPARVPFRRLAKLRLALPTRQHGLRAIVDAAAESAKVDLSCAIEADSLHALLDLARNGVAATILPRSVACRPGANVRTHQVVQPALLRQLVCVTHPRRPVATPAAALLKILVAQLRCRAQRP
jgi:LysR family transcriptional regulator, nitrogen assimilation regulatory protein